MNALPCISVLKALTVIRPIKTTWPPHISSLQNGQRINFWDGQPLSTKMSGYIFLKYFRESSIPSRLINPVWAYLAFLSKAGNERLITARQEGFGLWGV